MVNPREQLLINDRVALAGWGESIDQTTAPERRSAFELLVRTSLSSCQILKFNIFPGAKTLTGCHKQRHLEKYLAKPSFCQAWAWRSFQLSYSASDARLG